MVDEENNFSKEMSKKANIAVEEPIGNQSELLVGLGYNSITGRLTVEITKGTSFKNPLSRGDEKLPSKSVYDLNELKKLLVIIIINYSKDFLSGL